LLQRLAGDRLLPRQVRLRLGAAAGVRGDCRSTPVPDVVPVIGYADDAIINRWMGGGYPLCR
jgi:hypothetical protein